ncbi:ABC transporter substrate-binding protein [Alteromonas flava]|uniref:ABC transporter substrate-binding protein n=1 Tax=Alteromonas flava TaxID=2048003 RepID=UPI0013DD7BD0|nr:extracellular solute-binding protein [Alteromonas flava]
MLTSLTLVVIASISAPTAANTKPLKIAFLSAEPTQIASLTETVEKFQALYPDQTIELSTYSDARFKAAIHNWLKKGDFDIIHWQAGERLFRLVTQDLVAPINSLMDVDLIRHHYKSVNLQQLSRDGQLYGLPLAVYIWGFYYNKSVFAALDLQPPKTWQDFKHIARVLKQNSIKPLVQANQSEWETLAWLDYLSLMEGGETLRTKMVHGDPIGADKASELLAPLTELIDKEYFFAPDHEWSWVQAVAAVARGHAGMTLSGLFIEESLNTVLGNEVGFFAFPDSHRYGTVAPLDMLMIAKNSTNKPAAAKFLEYLATTSSSDKLALSLGWLPTSSHPLTNSLTERQERALATITSAPILVQYFDRDTDAKRSMMLDKHLDTLFASRNSKPLIDSIK